MKEIPVCSDCLKNNKESKLSPEEYFWVDKETHYTLHCIKCVEKYNLIISHPYQKKRGRPKGSKNKSK